MNLLLKKIMHILITINLVFYRNRPGQGLPWNRLFINFKLDYPLTATKTDIYPAVDFII